MPPIEGILPRVLAGERDAIGELVEALTPIVQVRVVRVLVRGARGRDVRHEVEDITQDVLFGLFADDARLLRGWDGARGLSLANYVGLLAEREALHLVRTRKRNPFELELDDGPALEDRAPSVAAAEDVIASRRLLEALWRRLGAELSPRGVELFRLLLVEERSVDSVCALMDMRPDAVYAWKSRFLRRVRALADELGASAATSGTAASPPSPPGERR